MSQTKTNALRIVGAKKIPYKTYEYDTSNGFSGGVSVAKSVGIDVTRVFKTLITQGTSNEYYVFVIPVADELDLKKAAKLMDEKKIEMIPSKDITKITGYVKGGCSPVGMKKLFKTAIDSSAKNLENIVVSAGKIGLQMDIPTSDLCKIVNAVFANLTN